MTSIDGVLPISQRRLEVRSTFVSTVGIVLMVSAVVFLAVWKLPELPVVAWKAFLTSWALALESLTSSVMRVKRSTSVPTAERPCAPFIRSPSQCPGSKRRLAALGR